MGETDCEPVIGRQGGLEDEFFVLPIKVNDELPVLGVGVKVTIIFVESYIGGSE